MHPSMTSQEIELFKKYVSKSIHYLEFGSGGSTVLADKFQDIKTIVSIESDHSFGNMVQKLCNKALVKWVDIGEISSYGHPKNESMRQFWPNYSCPNDLTIVPDTILIDGRFRVACGLQSCLKYPNATILIHDFTNRPEYHVLLNFLNIVEQVDTLIVAKVKHHNNNSGIIALYEHYKYIQD
jgi:hypothetical protein